MNEARLSRQMHSSAAAVSMAFVAVFYILFTDGIDECLPVQGGQGLCLPSPDMWNLPGWLDFCCGACASAIMLILMALLNKAYNVLRSVTRLQLGLFVIMSAATPSLVVNINTGILLAVAVNLCIFLLFGCFENPQAVRRVFLAFLILSLGAAMQYCFLVFIPVMWLITAQMRIFNLRTILASVFGVLTPWIIMLGFGFVTFDDFHLPRVTSIFSSLDIDDTLYLIAVTGFTAFLLVITTGLNITKTIAYNARARAYNGALTVIAIVTIISIAFDYNNVLAYAPLLNVCAAYQTTHWLVNHRFERQYAVIGIIIAVYLAFYLWRIIL